MLPEKGEYLLYKVGMYRTADINCSIYRVLDSTTCYTQQTLANPGCCQSLQFSLPFCGRNPWQKPSQHRVVGATTTTTPPDRTASAKKALERLPAPSPRPRHSLIQTTAQHFWTSPPTTRLASVARSLPPPPLLLLLQSTSSLLPVAACFRLSFGCSPLSALRIVTPPCRRALWVLSLPTAAAVYYHPPAISPPPPPQCIVPFPRPL